MSKIENQQLHLIYNNALNIPDKFQRETNKHNLDVTFFNRITRIQPEIIKVLRPRISQL